MSKQDKRIAELLRDPKSLRYSEIESLLKSLGFQTKELEGSHKLIYRGLDKSISTIVAIHNNDCLPIYKINLKKLYISVFGQ